eukprot:scaffold205610_cov39-Tisochrysis_lutea.AAC.1
MRGRKGEGSPRAAIWTAPPHGLRNPEWMLSAVAMLCRIGCAAVRDRRRGASHTSRTAQARSEMASGSAIMRDQVKGNINRTRATKRGRK